MKSLLFIFPLLFFLLFSCDNDLNINENWKDIPVIYGVLNSGTGEDLDNNGDPDENFNHFVRIQKSFLGPESAYTYTSIYDSLYYNPSDLKVWLETVNNQNGEVTGPYELELIDESQLDLLSIYKEEGLFATEAHYLYKIPNVASDLVPFDDLRMDYKINVLNMITGDTTFSQTNIVEPLQMSRPTLDNLLSSILSFTQPIQIKPSQHAKMYTISLRFNYIEQHKDDYQYDIEQGNPLPTTGVVYKYIDWNLGTVEADENQLFGNSVETVKKYITTTQFFEFIKSQIVEEDISSPQYYRYPVNTVNQGTGGGVPVGIYHGTVDLNITAVNSELYTYLNANSPNYGINQERPEYNNIENGVGHWSSRSVLNMNNLLLTSTIMDSLAFGEITNSLNFACYSTLGTMGLVVSFGFDCEED